MTTNAIKALSEELKKNPALKSKMIYYTIVRYAVQDDVSSLN